MYTYSQCDIVEGTLLRLAKAEIGRKGKCRFDTDSDASRLVFNFDDMDKKMLIKL